MYTIMKQIKTLTYNIRNNEVTKFKKTKIMANKQPTQEELLKQMIEAIEDQKIELVAAIEKLREGDYYGDPLPDSMADIAKSLRILSGREQLKH